MHKTDSSGNGSDSLIRDCSPLITHDEILKALNPADHGIWLELLFPLDSTFEATAPTIPRPRLVDKVNRLLGDPTRRHLGSYVIQQCAELDQLGHQADHAFILDVLMAEDGLGNALCLLPRRCSPGRILEELQSEDSSEEFVAKLSRLNVLVGSPNIVQHCGAEPRLLHLASQVPFRKALVAYRESVGVDAHAMPERLGG